jgi:hypothetical protein
MKLSNAVQSTKNYPLFSHKKRKVHGVTIHQPCQIGENWKGKVVAYRIFGLSSHGIIILLG